MSGRARPYAALLGLLVLAGGPAWAGRVQAASAGSRAAATQSGWWNRLQGPAEGEPDGNPIRPLVPAVPKPPTVPPDAIAAGAGAGQPDKVAAVGLDLSLAAGDTVDGLVLRLQESKAGGANVSADKAKVTACPATVPWGPSQNAAWRERPAADCSLGSAEGVRADDGTWTFDLSAIARRWTAPTQPLAPNGVVLAVDPAGSPSPVQISWLDVDSGHVAVDLTATPAPAPAASPAADAGAPAGPVPAPPADLAGPTRPYSAAARAYSTPGSGAGYPPALPTGAPTAAGPPPADGPPSAGIPPAAPAVAAETGPASAPARPGTTLAARPAVDFWERVPRASVVLVPITAAVAVLVGLVLGPTGRPTPIFRREGGLSRALARRPPAA